MTSLSLHTLLLLWACVGLFSPFVFGATPGATLLTNAARLKTGLAPAKPRKLFHADSTGPLRARQSPTVPLPGVIGFFANPDDLTPICYLQGGYNTQNCGSLSTARTFSATLSTSTGDIVSGDEYLALESNQENFVYTSTTSEDMHFILLDGSTGQGAKPIYSDSESTVWTVGSLQANGAAPISAIWVNPLGSPATIAVQNYVLVNQNPSSVLMYTSSYVPNGGQIVYPQYIP